MRRQVREDSIRLSLARRRNRRDALAQLGRELVRLGLSGQIWE